MLTSHKYGWDGLRALKSLIEKYKGKLPIIFDGKRGDIGKSSEAYANEAFNFWMADSLTVSPYMGADSVKPFLERCKDGREFTCSAELQTQARLTSSP